MLDIQQKRKVRAVAYSRVTLVVLGLVVLVALHSTWTVYNKKRDSEQLKNIAQEQLAMLEARDIDLKSKIQRLETTSGVEEEIRSKFSVAKNNENMVIVVPVEEAVASTTSQDRSFWDIIKNLFYN